MTPMDVRIDLGKNKQLLGPYINDLGGRLPMKKWLALLFGGVDDPADGDCLLVGSAVSEYNRTFEHHCGRSVVSRHGHRGHPAIRVGLLELVRGCRW